MSADWPGSGLIRASWAGTALLTATAVPADLAPAAFEVPALIVALVLFFGGIGAFVWAYVVAVGRSRDQEIAVAGLFLLSGSAPTPVRWHLLGSLGAQVAVALATAGARPFTSLAFGVLSPMYGLGLAGLWAARYGTFPPRSARPEGVGRPEPGRRRSRP